MNSFVKSCLKQITPPLIKNLYSIVRKPRYGWFGDYSSWNEACDQTTGYDDNKIIEKVVSATRKLLNGEAVFERDSVLFDHDETQWPLLSALLWMAKENGGNLKILDFGGALGSIYNQNKKWLGKLNILEWSIIEQEKFVNIGKKDFENSQLKFYHTIEECIKERRPDILMLASVLPYLKAPYDMLSEWMSYDFEYILVDRTGFTGNNKDRLTIQKVDPFIYDAQYPCWFFSRDKFFNCFKSKYELVMEWDSFGDTNIQTFNKGFLFRKII